MARLIAALIRHGDYHQLPDTPSAHQPFPLTKKGRQQARTAADDIRRELDASGAVLCDAIDSSRMLRGWETAAELADALGRSSSQVESFDALAERSVGSAANLSIGQIEAILRQDPRFPAPPPGWKSDSHYCLPLQGAESLMMAGQRVAAHLQQRMEQLPGVVERDTLKLFVGHGAAFRHAAYHLGVLQFEQLARVSMFHGRPVYIEYRVGSGWRHVGGEWKLRGENAQEID